MEVSFDDLPAYLTVPPASSVRPPVQTRTQQLPLHELHWEDFERLCLRCARIESDVERAHIYGKRGQAQAGIDLYVRKKGAGGQYRVYQCKNVKDFGPAKIIDAVDTFVNGSWAERAKEFVLCTRESLQSTERADEFEKQVSRLAKSGITLIPWDKEALEGILKDAPRLVDDFFGRAWAIAFCGEQVAGQLDKRLDAEQLKEFRKKLASFYSNIFRLHDRGLPSLGPESGETFDIRERYVIPDVIDERNPMPVQPEADRVTESTPTEVISSPGRENDERRSGSVRKRVPARQRIGLEDWLTAGRRSVVVADFGLGKSTLLRFLALDLLNETPRLNRLSDRWSGHLPVWVPFPLWTRLLAEPGASDVSLSVLLLHWLRGLGEERLGPLIEQALADDRLLLLVDGLDEWANETVATIAAQRLELFVSQHDVLVVAAGRPAGYARVSMQTQGWQKARLADFNEQQQRQLAQRWFEFWHRNAAPTGTFVDPDEMSRRSGFIVDHFIAEVNSPALSHLAGVPLLLSLMVYLKLQNVTIPDSRFKAYDELIRLLIKDHPKRRRVAAGVVELPDSLSEGETTRVLASLAFAIQRDHGDGLVLRDEAVQIVERFLRADDGLGLDVREAHRHATSAIETGGASTGLIVERSDDEIAFFHRSFQEYLAAQHLSRLPFEEQLVVAKTRCADVRWHEVLLALLRLTSRAGDVTKLLHAIKDEPQDLVAQHDVELLLCEAAAGEYNCPPPLGRDLVDDAIKEVETGAWMSHRERLLNRLLAGLRTASIRDRLQRKVIQWFPGRIGRRDLYMAVGKWKVSIEVSDALWRGLYDEDVGNQRAAAMAIATRDAGSKQSGDRMATLARCELDHLVRCAALEALALGWPDHPDLAATVEATRSSGSPDLQWAAAFAAIHSNKQTDVDLRILLKLGRRHGSGVAYEHSGGIGDLLARGWPGLPVLKAGCVIAIDRRVTPQDGAENAKEAEVRDLDPQIAFEVLLKAYPHDVEVGQRLAAIIENDNHPLVGMFQGDVLAPWKLLLVNFSGNPDLVAAIDTLLLKRNLGVMEVAVAAQIGKTSVSKETLLRHLSDWYPHWAAEALLDGWGMADLDVMDRLTAIANAPALQSTKIAYLFPRIISDRQTCRNRLLTLLGDPACALPSARADFVLDGLSTLGGLEGDTEACTLALRIYKQEPKDDYWFSIAGQIMRCFPDDPRVREVALAELSRRGGNEVAVARTFGEDPEIRQIILDRLSPLPARLRDTIAVHLSDRPLGDSFATDVLRRYDREADAEVQVRASVGYHRRLRRSQANCANAVEQLRGAIACYGPHHEERRQAAFCGLIALDRLDIVRDAKETIGDDPRHRVELSVRYDRPNMRLLEYIAQHWLRLKTVFGEDLIPRLSRQKLEPIAVWDTLSIVAAEHSDLRTATLTFLESQAVSPPRANLLRFVARVRPRSDMLRRHCLAALLPEGRIDHWNSDAETVAADLLAEHFAGDAAVLNDLTAGLQPTLFPDGVALALILGWKFSDQTAQYLRAVTGTQRRVSFQLHIAMTFWLSPAPEFVNYLMNYIETLAYPRFAADWGFRVAVRRLASDDEAYALLTELHQRKLQTAHARASLPRLFAVARGMSIEMRRRLYEELSQEMSPDTSPTVGYDLAENQIRAVALALTDALAIR